MHRHQLPLRQLGALGVRRQVHRGKPRLHRNAGDTECHTFREGGLHGRVQPYGWAVQHHLGEQGSGLTGGRHVDRVEHEHVEVRREEAQVVRLELTREVILGDDRPLGRIRDPPFPVDLRHLEVEFAGRPGVRELEGTVLLHLAGHRDGHPDDVVVQFLDTRPGTAVDRDPGHRLP